MSSVNLSGTGKPLEIEWSFEPYCVEIPYWLLQAAEGKALEIVHGLEAEDGSTHPFWNDLRNWLSGYGDEMPLWCGEDLVTEVYHRGHEGFKKCYWIRLSWKKFQADRNGMYKEIVNVEGFAKSGNGLLVVLR